MASDMADAKISLPNFLKLLTGNNVPVPKAMAVAGKIYKDYNTPAKLTVLSDVKLKAAGIEAPEDRKLVMAALRKSGYAYKGRALTIPNKSETDAGSVAGPATPSVPTTVEILTTPTKRKRKHAADINQFLPDGPTEDTGKYGSMEFNEVMDEEVLTTKSTVINRAPLMTAWSTLVAERMNFSREEALSIASVYTEMNAVSKGVSLGLFEKGKEQGLEATRGGSQPYVELMGRRPLYHTQTGQWRALSNGTPAEPSTAFLYISRALRQTTPHIIGALKLLAESYTQQELNKNAWSLYADFRPTADGWGKRSEVLCSTILALRKKSGAAMAGSESMTKPMIQHKILGESTVIDDEGDPPRKKTRALTLEEYEAALDEDNTFDDVNLDFAAQST